MWTKDYTGQYTGYELEMLAIAASDHEGYGQPGEWYVWFVQGAADPTEYDEAL